VFTVELLIQICGEVALSRGEVAFSRGGISLVMDAGFPNMGLVKPGFHPLLSFWVLRATSRLQPLRSRSITQW